MKMTGNAASHRASCADEKGGSQNTKAVALHIGLQSAEAAGSKHAQLELIDIGLADLVSLGDLGDGNAALAFGA